MIHPQSHNLLIRHQLLNRLIRRQPLNQLTLYQHRNLSNRHQLLTHLNLSLTILSIQRLILKLSHINHSLTSLKIKLTLTDKIMTTTKTKLNTPRSTYPRVKKTIRWSSGSWLLYQLSCLQLLCLLVSKSADNVKIKREKLLICSITMKLKLLKARLKKNQMVNRLNKNM